MPARQLLRYRLGNRAHRLLLNRRRLSATLLELDNFVMGSSLSKHLAPAQLQALRNCHQSTAKWAAVFVALHQVFKRTPALNLQHCPAAAASRAAGVIHATLTCVGALPQVFMLPLSELRKRTDAENTEFENKLLDLSVGYFIVDLLWLAAVDRDAMLLLHHFAALILFGSCRMLREGRGARVLRLRQLIALLSHRTRRCCSNV